MSMKSQSGISLNNAAVAATPKHLLQFAVDQRYDDYTPVDHAVWRFIMRQNVFFLREYAHKVYFQGLLDTGISFERIPRIQEMNDILAKIEWGAKAMSSKKDFELYQAIRHLSILKEQPNSGPKEVEEATKLVEHRQKTLGQPSEMALLSRLHWWTVEYGLIGTLENPKIYG